MEQKKKIKVRLFVGRTCPICDIAMLKLANEKDIFEYQYVDALHDKTQKLCDENEVDELPHIQIYEEDEVVAEFIGPDVLTALRDICD